MRSSREVLFRIRQEIANLRLFAFPPVLENLSWEPVGVPAGPAVASHIAGSAFAAEVEELAEKILAGIVPMLDANFSVGRRPSWRKDYVSEIESGQSYFRRIPYLDAARVGDHKIVWELNRHQHLVLLSMASLLSGREDYLAECERQLESWLQENSFLRGINWTSALEVAFRALSWIWILAWRGQRLSPQLRARLVASLYQHGLYLEYNLSVYFSPNTHLLGEAVVLHLLGRFFPEWPRSASWERQGSRIVEEQLHLQIQADGAHFEQSTYYHVYAVDFFLLHRIFARQVSSTYDQKLRDAAEYLRAILGPEWRIPLIGDDDGGRLFHPYGNRPEFGRATLATASLLFHEPSWLRDPDDCNQQALWWLGPRSAVRASATSLPSRLFSASGMAVMSHRDVYITVDAGPFGWAGAGHSHSDTLSVTVCAGGEEILVDAGTYTYVGEPRWRDWFRSSAAHNTVRIDANDQGDPAGPFRWRNKPETAIENWESTSDRDKLTAVCRYRGLTHRRHVIFTKGLLEVVIEDEVSSASSDTLHFIEQFWHCGVSCESCGPFSWRIGSRALLTLSDTGTSELSTGGEHGWRSRVLGRKEPSPVLRLHARTPLPVRFTSKLALQISTGV